MNNDEFESASPEWIAQAMRRDQETLRQEYRAQEAARRKEQQEKEEAAYEPLVIDETDTIAVPRVVLQGIYDLAVESPFLGSGYWDREDYEVSGYVENLLGVEEEKRAR